MKNTMSETINKIFEGGKGILAADESTPTIDKRFRSVQIPSTAANRHAYRYTIFSSNELESYIGGVILYDETLRNSQTIAPLRDKDIVLGIKVDKGTRPYDESGGKLTEGLDGLNERLQEYKQMGAKFAKWRAVLSVTDTDACVLANAGTLARYAKKCQDQGLVPIVEPEVLMDGKHNISISQAFTDKVLHHVFDALFYEQVSLEHIILKPNMILNGYESGYVNQPQITALATLDCFRRRVPAAVPVVAFLSGGQKDEDAIQNLAEMNTEFYLPWVVSFSFGRTMQRGALMQWSLGKTSAAKGCMTAQAKSCVQAVGGEYAKESVPKIDFTR